MLHITHYGPFQRQSSQPISGPSQSVDAAFSTNNLADIDKSTHNYNEKNTKTQTTKTANSCTTPCYRALYVHIQPGKGPNLFNHSLIQQTSTAYLLPGLVRTHPARQRTKPIQPLSDTADFHSLLSHLNGRCAMHSDRYLH